MLDFNKKAIEVGDFCLFAVYGRLYTGEVLFIGKNKVTIHGIGTFLNHDVQRDGHNLFLLNKTDEGAT